ERHHDRFKLRLVELQGEISGSFQSRNRDAFALDVLFFHGLGGDDDGAIAFAETGAAVKEYVFVANGGIRGEADGGDVVRFRDCSFVQSLNVGENVGVLVTGRGQLVGGQRIKHEGVIGVG